MCSGIILDGVNYDNTCFVCKINVYIEKSYQK